MTEGIDVSGREVEPVDEAPSAAARPSAADLVDAIQQTAAAMNAMADRVEDLESAIDAERRSHHETAAELESVRQLLEASKAAVEEAKGLRGRTEILAMQHVKRADRLEAELASVRDDLTLVADAIVDAGLQHIGRNETQAVTAPPKTTV